MRANHLLTSIAATLAVLVASPCAGFPDTPPDGVLRKYIDALLREDWPAAERCWTQSEVERSRALGVQFESTPAKYDCASPILGAIEAIRAGAVTYEIGTVTDSRGVGSAILTLSTGSTSVQAKYYMIMEDDEWRLCSAITPHTRNWSKLETQFTRIVYSDSSLLNDFAIDELDKFIGETARLFGVTGLKLELLESGKIEYYLCNEEEIERLTGYPVHGMTHVPLDAVVTRHLPHYHETVHAIANVVLSPLPLHTAPFMQEGLAVSTGGRWEKAAGVMTELGAFLIEEEFGNLDDILSYSSFHSPSADLDANYAISGLFLGFLQEAHGHPSALKAYRQLSGSNAELLSWDAAYVKSELSKLLATPWSSVERSFREYASRNRSGHLLPGGEPAGSTPDFHLKADSLDLQIWETDSFFVFEVGTFPTSTGAILLLSDSSVVAEPAYQSRLYAKHLPGRPYGGERFAIAFTNAEAGLYDYYTDNLTEKYVTGIYPGDGYWSDTTGHIRFRLRKSALPRPLTEFDLDLTFGQP